ncbi:DUF6415 family natural product biosynthesis protein [Streptomyces sp. NBC_00306]|uniref:DUF6415 family natural product biosynthesis protein n=1 Tax=Streptomyces sp. NBC_00306 TaxID=2975708 RepID=UPI002E27AAE4|nr:DUF6415 family natural product biosynthesis protein [Streptomyces sp. NBC_00306]
MQRVLDSLRLSLVDENVYDDLEDVLSPYSDLDETRMADLTARLRLALADLLPAVRRTHDQLPAFARAIELRDAQPPEDAHDALVHLRHLALTTLGLLDLLTA